jgi:hypothetical protein
MRLRARTKLILALFFLILTISLIVAFAFNILFARASALLGKRNGAILTPELVKSIRAEYVRRDPEHGSSAIARRLGVTSRCVMNVVNGVSWKDLPERPSRACASAVRPVGIVGGPPEPREGAVTLGAGQIYYPPE